jgi:hypothetical protein
MSLPYQNPEDSQHGETSRDTDTIQSRFVELVPFENIVWFLEFQSEEPGLTGQMRITWSLADAGEGTVVNLLCDGVSQDIRQEDNEADCRSSPQKLAPLRRQELPQGR